MLENPLVFLLKNIPFLFPWLIFYEFANFFAGFKKPITIKSTTKENKDFSILIPVYNHTAYLKPINVRFLKKYGRQVILCTTDDESREFYLSLGKIARENGFRIYRAKVIERNQWSIFKVLLVSQNIRSKYVILLDGDTVAKENLSKLCGLMEESNFDLASLRIMPQNSMTFLEKLQNIEYDISMQARLIYPWLTSGACLIAKNESLKKIMAHHSCFLPGGDIEIGKIANYLGLKIGHLRFTLFTKVPSTFKAWWKQRILWWSGTFQHAIINLKTNWRHPFFFAYFSCLVWFLLPSKMYESIVYWWTIPLVMLIYIPFTLLINWRLKSVKSWLIFFFPFYAWLQVFFLIWFGIIKYFMIFKKTKNPGIIKLKKAASFKTSYLVTLGKLTLLTFYIFSIIFFSVRPLQVALLGDSLTMKVIDFVDQGMNLIKENQLVDDGFSKIQNFKKGIVPRKIVKDFDINLAAINSDSPNMLDFSLNEQEKNYLPVADFIYYPYFIILTNPFSASTSTS